MGVCLPLPPPKTTVPPALYYQVKGQLGCHRCCGGAVVRGWWLGGGGWWWVVLTANLVFILSPNLKTKTLLRSRPKLNNIKHKEGIGKYIHVR